MIKRARVSYWILSGFIKKHTRILLFGIVLGIIGSLFLPSLIQKLPQPKTTEKIAVVGRPTISEIPQFIQNEISFGLTSITPSGEATPAAASSYQVHENGKRFVFTLRKGLSWHDGKPFTAEDINYNFSDVQVKTLGSNKIEFILKEPYVPFPTTVSQPLFRQKKSGLFPVRTTLIGLNSFEMTKLKRNGQFIKDLHLTSKDLKRHYRFYNTQEAAILAFKLGEVDKILELSTPGELSTWPNTKVEEVTHKNRYVALFFNTQDPELSSKGFRQALTDAVSLKPDDDQRAISPIHPLSWAFNPQVKRYEYNLETAKSLIEEEKEGRDNFNPQIELTTTLAHIEAAEQIKAEWQNLGIKTNVKIVSFLPENFQVLLIAQEIPPDPDQYGLWHSTQATNITSYNSPKVDKLLEDGRQTVDQKERIIIYHDFQRFLVEDTPSAFLYHHRTYTISRS